MREALAAQGQEKGKTVWFLAQAFSWEPYFKGWMFDRNGNAKPPFQRTPTFDEVRTMAWLGLACGARGLFYYSFWTQGFYVRDAYPVFWKGFEESLKEITALLPVLLGADATPPARVDSEEVVVLAKRVGGDLFLIAANTSNARVEATITLPGLAGRKMTVISEARQISPKADQFTDSFSPLETHLYTTGSAPNLRTLPEIRAELATLEEAFRRENFSLCTLRDGARLFPSMWKPEEELKWQERPWYRMIDGFPGTPWVCRYKQKGRWIEVRLKEQKRLSEIVAILSPHSAFEAQILNGTSWQTVAGEKVIDQPPRHYQHASATTTCRFQPLLTDRFRIVFTDTPGSDASPDVVFELMAR